MTVGTSMHRRLAACGVMLGIAGVAVICVGIKRTSSARSELLGYLDAYRLSLAAPSACVCVVTSVLRANAARPFVFCLST